ncbi:hypothetical protein P4U24_17375 [Aeribacillus composti]|nr:hypothetical protein [Aeribacillus composti]
MEGNGRQSIARRLYNEGVPTPAQMLEKQTQEISGMIRPLDAS